ncbi:ABC transporter permease [Butyrivibrio fibrisolvens]|uniref:ABC transporter permease n=1 Tax=Butyrivibrio fibrisolvens TaxID=831 RepID=UPI000411B74C|nr:ABC transporter permease [Butyrivibrio fibrisolvens]
MLVTKASVINLKKYTPLIRELVMQDVKLKYRRSFLGYLWSLLNPLLMMGVMTFVFSSIFTMNVKYFPLYIITGHTMYSFFNESTTIAMNSIKRNRQLIKKVYIPKFIFPISSVASSFVTMSFNLVAIIIVKVFMRVPFYWTDLLFWLPLLLELIFCMGLGMILASFLVYFRDIEHLYSVLLFVWMYMTPIFYSLDGMPSYVVRVVKLNPLYHYITCFRELMIMGTLPAASEWLISLAYSLVMVVIGAAVFKKLQRNFILYL